MEQAYSNCAVFFTMTKISYALKLTLQIWEVCDFVKAPGNTDDKVILCYSQRGQSLSWCDWVVWPFLVTHP